jgi:hypothetical protein
MILFRTADDRILTRKPDEQYFTDDNDVKHTRLYLDHNGWPVNEHGTPIFGNFVTTMHYTLEEFAKAFPEKASKIKWLEGRQRGKTALVQSLPPAWFCGSFAIVHMYPAFEHPKGLYKAKASVLVNDGDDGYMRKTFDTDAEAEAAFNELLTLAPWYMGELGALGYQPE